MQSIRFIKSGEGEVRHEYKIDSKLSLYIPYVKNSISVDFIKDIFEKTLRFGKVSSVQFKRFPMKSYSTAFIHFDYWKDNVVTRNFQERLHKFKSTRIVHDDPYYWIVLENKSKDKTMYEEPDQMEEEDVDDYDSEKEYYDEEERFRGGRCQDNLVRVIDCMMYESHQRMYNL